MGIPAEQCAGLLRDALSNRPADPWSEDAAAWFGEVAGIVSAHDALLGVPFQSLLASVTNRHSGILSPVSSTLTMNAQAEFITRARSVLTQLQLATNAFTTRQLAAGEVHDYFEEIRQLISAATREILFVDPYIDPNFVSRYLPLVPNGVAVRLLTVARQSAALRSSLDLFSQQHGTAVYLRVVEDRSLHDRHLIIDGERVYQSGASFKDGAKNAPTSINQIVDAGTAVIGTIEASWAAATPA